MFQRKFPADSLKRSRLPAVDGALKQQETERRRALSESPKRRQVRHYSIIALRAASERISDGLVPYGSNGLMAHRFNPVAGGIPEEGSIIGRVIIA
jgi:hypothetical protein